MKTILLLSPHPDDVEFGCGASVSKWISKGHNVHLVIFSPCDKSLPEGYKKGDIYKESEMACSSLGIVESNVTRLNFEVRDFPENRQDILEELIKIKKRLNPDLVVLPNSNDIHQDHKTINEEGIRAFKSSSIIGYELPWNSLEFKSNYHSKVSNTDLENKFKAIEQYKSQSNRSYFNKEFFFGLAKMRGTQVNTAFAEAFEMIRWID